MFNTSRIAHLAKEHQDVFKDLAAIEDDLTSRFYKMKEPVRALILAAAAGESLLFIGPPGTGKSHLIRSFCAHLGLINENNPSQAHSDYFEYLLTRFTEPAELFGYYNLAKAAKTGKLARLTKNTLPKSKVVYLDEVFNASSAILNALLAIMQEGIFHDRGRRVEVKVQLLLGATNTVPEAPELRAFYDRFLLRCPVHNLDIREEDPTGLSQFLEKGLRETYGRRGRGNHQDNPQRANEHSILDRLKAFQEDLEKEFSADLLQPHSSRHNDLEFWKTFAAMVDYARQSELSEMSNRRLVKIVHLMIVHRIYDAVRADEAPSAPQLSLRKEELALIPRYLLDRFDDQVAMQHLRSLSDLKRLEMNHAGFFRKSRS